MGDGESREEELSWASERRPPPRWASSVTSPGEGGAERTPRLTKEGLFWAGQSAAARSPGLAGSHCLCSSPVATRLQGEREGRGAERGGSKLLPPHPFSPVSCAPQTALQGCTANALPALPDLSLTQSSK